MHLCIFNSLLSWLSRKKLSILCVSFHTLITAAGKQYILMCGVFSPQRTKTVSLVGLAHTQRSSKYLLTLRYRLLSPAGATHQPQRQSCWDRKQNTAVHTSHLVNFWSLHVGSGTNMGMVRVCLQKKKKTNNIRFFSNRQFTRKVKQKQIEPDYVQASFFSVGNKHDPHSGQWCDFFLPTSLLNESTSLT